MTLNENPCFNSVKNKICIIRTYSAGVHYGTVDICSSDMTVVTLLKARRIWRWKGANTLNEVAKSGLSDNSKISEIVPTITIAGAIEYLPVSDEAIRIIDGVIW